MRPLLRVLFSGNPGCGRTVLLAHLYSTLVSMSSAGRIVFHAGTRDLSFLSDLRNAMLTERWPGNGAFEEHGKVSLVVERKEKGLGARIWARMPFSSRPNLEIEMSSFDGHVDHAGAWTIVQVIDVSALKESGNGKGTASASSPDPRASAIVFTKMDLSGRDIPASNDAVARSRLAAELLGLKEARGLPRFFFSSTTTHAAREGKGDPAPSISADGPPFEPMFSRVEIEALVNCLMEIGGR